MNRIMIIGCPGSGKSTFAKMLSKELDLPCVHLDRLFWKEGWIQRSKDEFDYMLIEELKKDSWIIDGNYSRTISLRLNYADTVIFLDYSRFVCLWRVIKRIIKNYGNSRSDMGNGCPEKFDFEFVKYVWTFNGNERKKIYQKLSAEHNAEMIIVRNNKEFRKLKKNIFNIHS